jgi:hypothetical protein
MMSRPSLAEGQSPESQPSSVALVTTKATYSSSLMVMGLLCPQKREGQSPPTRPYQGNRKRARLEAVGTKRPSPTQISALIELWNALVAEAKKGLPANPEKKKTRNTAGALLRLCPGRESFELRARILLSEKFRESAYTTLGSLHASWESLGAKEKAYLEAKAQGGGSGPGNPPTPMEEIKAYWDTPMGDISPIRKWLEKH